MDMIRLDSEALSVTILPERGGKLASIRHAATGSELLAQPPHGYPPLRPGMPFEQGDASGFDDVFPSMGEDALEGRWREVPDHGIVWTHPMEETSAPEGWRAFRFCEGEWDYRKMIWLRGDTIDLRWEIVNRRNAEAACGWVCHCLW